MLFCVVDFLGMVGELNGTLSLTYNGLGLACLLPFLGMVEKGVCFVPFPNSIKPKSGQ